MNEFNTTKEISPVYEEINDLLSESKFNFVDYFLETADPVALSDLMLVALPSLTYSSRDKLPNWNEFVIFCKQELDSRGIDSKLELKGLLNG